MVSPQTLSEPDRRLVASWAADCAERVLPLLGADRSGPLGVGLLTTGVRGRAIRALQAEIGAGAT